MWPPHVFLLWIFVQVCQEVQRQSRGQSKRLGRVYMSNCWMVQFIQRRRFASSATCISLIL